MAAAPRREANHYNACYREFDVPRFRSRLDMAGHEKDLFFPSIVIGTPDKCYVAENEEVVSHYGSAYERKGYVAQDYEHGADLTLEIIINHIYWKNKWVFCHVGGLPDEDAAMVPETFGSVAKYAGLTSVSDLAQLLHQSLFGPNRKHSDFSLVKVPSLNYTLRNGSPPDLMEIFERETVVFPSRLITILSLWRSQKEPSDIVLSGSDTEDDFAPPNAVGSATFQDDNDDGAGVATDESEDLNEYDGFVPLTTAGPPVPPAAVAVKSSPLDLPTQDPEVIEVSDDSDVIVVSGDSDVIFTGDVVLDSAAEVQIKNQLAAASAAAPSDTTGANFMFYDAPPTRDSTIVNRFKEAVRKVAKSQVQHITSCGGYVGFFVAFKEVGNVLGRPIMKAWHNYYKDRIAVAEIPGKGLGLVVLPGQRLYPGEYFPYQLADKDANIIPGETDDTKLSDRLLGYSAAIHDQAGNKQAEAFPRSNYGYLPLAARVNEITATDHGAASGIDYTQLNPEGSALPQPPLRRSKRSAADAANSAISTQVQETEVSLKLSLEKMFPSYSRVRLIEMMKSQDKGAYYKTSNIMGAGDGLFAKKTFERGEIIAVFWSDLYNGKKVSDYSVENSHAQILGDETFDVPILFNDRDVQAKYGAVRPLAYYANQLPPSATNAIIDAVNDYLCEDGTKLPILRATKVINIDDEIYIYYGEGHPLPKKQKQTKV